jgi:hypothetical protein
MIKFAPVAGNRMKSISTVSNVLPQFKMQSQKTTKKRRANLQMKQNQEYVLLH